MKIRSYRLELKLNESQRVLCNKSSGTARFAYNWMLQKLTDNYDLAKKDSDEKGLVKVSFKLGTSMDWHKEWVLLKYDLPWIRETSSKCGQESRSNIKESIKRAVK
jgi:hypothetical protein